MKPRRALEHGGRVRQAAFQYGIAIEHWLDLSTGINPLGWPVPHAPAAVWSRLPEDEDELGAAAGKYYGSESVLPVAGSQAAIQALPRLRDRSRVALLAPCYAEHSAAWRRAGHEIASIAAGQIDGAVNSAEVLVLINPNNPTGFRFKPRDLLQWRAALEARGGWLVVDEAFMDATPERSLASFCPLPGLIVLRSLGKFFGLAGARVGFVLAEQRLLASLDELLGPWTIATPSRWTAAKALADRDWQRRNRAFLAVAAARLARLLTRHGLQPDGGCDLFQWVPTPEAPRLHERLARQGVLTRLFSAPPSLRFGLPGAEADWQRLDRALDAATGIQHPAD